MSGSLTVLLVASGVVFALCGIAVRIQFALFRGFDFVCAMAVLAAAESSVWLSRLVVAPEWMRLYLGITAALLVATGIVATWNHYIDRWFRLKMELGGGLLVLSLGISTAAVGLVTVLRGPGLRQVPPASLVWLSRAGGPGTYAVCAGSVVLLVILFWTRARPGFALNLWAQDSAFASEIGIDRKQLVVGSGLAGGACLGVVGSYLAMAGGSTPEIGLPAFLYGAASALLLPGGTIGRSALGGLVLGPLFVAVQLAVAPAFSNSVLFILTLGLLLYRGTSRSAQQVR